MVAGLRVQIVWGIALKGVATAPGENGEELRDQAGHVERCAESRRSPALSML
jgi:hypothetical protein